MLITQSCLYLRTLTNSFIDSVQYNWSLISPFFLVHAKLRSALSNLGGADEIVMQSIVVE